jgi:glutathione S-transferase
MKLYGFPLSPNTWKVRAAAAHIGQPLDLVMVDLTKGEQRKPDYLALNPTGRTPTLVDGDFVLSESEAIMQYICDRAPNTLWPNTPRSRADVVHWQCWQLAHWGKESCEPLILERLVKKALNIGAPDAAVIKKATDGFHRDASVLDAHLAKHTWLVGNTVTLADFSVAAPLFLRKEAELPVEPYAHVREWFGRVAALPACRDTAPNFAAVA